MTNLALEAATGQFPLVRHAVDVGWAFVPEAAPLDATRNVFRVTVA